ncbi:hypothetical protein HPULCUR_009387 [Helicostylum pulchrum]|uniref:CST complex subunit CTC1 n=1 Tax=Helicostylum pulchrum TaxID=562976 RepID=A0ABP9YC76_9FUNG
MSSIITPDQLFQKTHGQTSNGQKLSGMLFMVSKEASLERGTVELIDLTTKQFIPCLVDLFLPRYHRVKVLITKWNYIFDHVSGYRYLEFQLDSVFTERSEESILRRHYLSQNTLYRSLQQHVFYVPNRQLSCATAKSIDLAGQIYAISSLFAPPDVRSYFYLQLVRDQQCVTIQFSGKDCEKYHRYFRIGSLHCFKDLSITSVSERDMFSFDSNASACAITPIQYQKIAIKPNHPTYPLTVTEVQNPANFTGTITRVIDALFGIYELEKKLTLCLFHYTNYSPSKPFRLGTRLRIFQFHATKLSKSLQHTSHLLNLWQLENDCPMLIGCQNTSIEIESFAVHCTVPTEPIQLIDLKHKVYMDIVMRQTNFTQLMQQLEIYAMLEYRFSNMADLDAEAIFTAFKSIRRHALGTIEPCQIDSEGFLRHDEICQVVTCGKNVMLNSFPDLKNVKSSLEDKLFPYSLDLAGENHAFEQNKVLVQRALFENEFYLVGLVEMADDGRIMFVDNSSRILLNAQDVKLGAIYICARARLFCEDLSIVDMATGKAVQPDCTYLSFDVSDLYVAYRPPQRSFQIQQDISSVPVDYFVCDQLVENAEQRLSVVHVITTFPIEVTHQGEKVMESRMVAVMYGLLGPRGNPIGINPGKRIVLVTNNRNQSLKFNRQLQPDRWCVILGLIRPGSNANKTTFFLSEELHEICPIIMNTTTQTANAIQLRAIIPNPPQSSASLTNIIEPTYNVSQFLTEALCPDQKYLHKEKYFYVKPVNITGIIVSKHFSKGFAENVVSSEEAEEDYCAFGVGTSKPNRNIQVQLRQLDGLESVVIYIDSPTQHYPLGLVEGAHVTFRNLLRKHGRHSAYRFHCITNSVSTFEVETTLAPETDVINKEDTPVMGLSQLHKEVVDGTEREDTILKVCCYIRSFISLRLKWYCITCESNIRNGNCYYFCESREQVFLASAYIEVSDSKASGNANVDGEKLVFQLLNLNKRQRETLKQAVYKYGEIFYEGWRAPEQTKRSNNEVEYYEPYEEEQEDQEMSKEEKEERKEDEKLFQSKQKIGYQVRDICNKAKARGNIWIYAKRQFEKKPELLQRLRKVRMSDKNGTVTTWEFEKIKLKVIEIEETDACKLAYQYLLEGLSDYMNQ